MAHARRIATLAIPALVAVFGCSSNDAASGRKSDAGSKGGGGHLAGSGGSVQGGTGGATSSGGVTSTGGTTASGGSAGSSVAGAPGNGGSGNQADFDARCNAPGVVACITWDDDSAFVPASGGSGYASGLYPADDDTYPAIRDTNIKVDGAGALKFVIRPGSEHPHNTNPAGYWLQQFGPDGAGTAFGEGTTFYMQFRLRVSPELLDYDWTQAGGQGWKVFIVWGPIPGPSCTGDQFVQENSYNTNVATGYTSCGSPALYTNDGNPPMDIEQGDYNCAYSSDTPYSAPDCFIYPADTWLTEYWVVKIGAYGEPNTSFDAYIARDGEPLKQFIHLTNFVFGDSSDHAVGLQALELTPYFSGANGSTTTPGAAMWFDDLIVSTQPIDPPK